MPTGFLSFLHLLFSKDLIFVRYQQNPETKVLKICTALRCIPAKFLAQYSSQGRILKLLDFVTIRRNQSI
ncbi:hypothetical protein K2173_016919 [Erythroxylum novogranatense]|uniref:Uncharacterized protein n=1 Tax=Erythroxylum novogranatense TaxID=1862640 RepID=A0AAV8U819_9ROSI|nr:hypothetical protein K2173_016919 [Erythroxylum novogranatense]